MNGLLLNLTPGMGVLFARVTYSGETTLRAFRKGIIEGIPVLSSCHRVSPFLGNDYGRSKLYSIIGHEVSGTIEGCNRATGTHAKKPVINRRYMQSFYSRMGIDEEQMMQQLGVADEQTVICFGRTANGGGVILVSTGEEVNRARLGHAWSNQIKYRTDPLGEDEFRRFAEDVSVLTALAKINRLTIYYQMCLAAGWPRKTNPKNIPTTIYSGFCARSMEMYHQGVCVADNMVYCVPVINDEEGGSLFCPQKFVFIEAPSGKDNVVFPASWSSGKEPSQPHNWVTVQSCARIANNQWIIENNKSL